jgi:hypothetical protein
MNHTEFSRKSVTIFMAVAVLLFGFLATISPASAQTTWNATYWNNPTMSGNPVLYRNESAINNYWGTGGPGGGVANDNFSAVWTSNIYFNAGTYQFTATMDDGMRVWIDNNLVIDEWRDGSVRTIRKDVYLTTGTHTIRVNYYERAGDATAVLAWAQQTAPATGWSASYWNNTTLSGNPVFSRNEAEINHNWGQGGPGFGVNNDNFSARWTRTAYFDAGNYRFRTTMDDGLRLWVDNVLVIDAWYSSAVHTINQDYYLNAGNHTIKVEYFELLDNATAIVSWERLNVATPVPPQPTPIPTATPRPNGVPLLSPTVFKGKLQANGLCLDETEYVGVMGACNNAGTWSVHRLSSGKQLIQNDQNNYCLARTTYQNGNQLRLQVCDGNNSNQHFQFNQNSTSRTISFWLDGETQAQRTMGIGGWGNNRAHLVPSVFNWTY